MIKILTLVAATLFTINAFAIDTAKCPDSIKIKVQVDEVYKTSKYSKIPGWLEARKTLAALNSMETELSLSKKSTSCVYKDRAQNLVTLSTTKFHDPEEQNPQLVDQLVLNLNIEKSSYVSFVPVKEYGPKGISLHSDEFAVKVKTRLFISQTKRWANIDLGMVTVSAK